MFGKRQSNSAALSSPEAGEVETPKPVEAATPAVTAQNTNSSASGPSEEYYETKATIFNALFETKFGQLLMK